MSLRNRWTQGAIAVAWFAAVGVGIAQQAPVRDAARPPTVGTASLAGLVVGDDEGHTPIPHAVLTLSMSGSNAKRSTATDEAGRFVFPDLPAAVYTLSAARGAYLTASYGALGPDAPPLPIPLKDGQRFVASPIVLVRGAVVVGRVTDAAGRPMADTTVQALRVSSGAVVQLAPSVRGFARTDSRGLYRIYGLAAGDYVVNASGVNGLQAVGAMSEAEVRWLEQHQTTRAGEPPAAVPTPPPVAHSAVNAPTYFPGVADVASATVLSLGKAEERQGIDIAVLRIGAARVSGIVYGLDGQPLAGAFVFRSSKRGSTASPFEVSAFTGQARSTAEGAFTLTGVTPGDYLITTRAAAGPPAPRNAAGPAMPSGPLTLWGQADISVSGDDLTGLAIHLQPGMTISGAIVFEGTTPSPTDMGRFQPRLQSLDENVPNVTIDPGGAAAPKAGTTFTIEGVTPGQYILAGAGNVPSTAGASPPWRIKSATAGGRDLLDTPFDVHPREDLANVVVTYSDRHTELDGHLTDAAGQPVSQFRVLVFAANRDRWVAHVLPRWMASARAGVDGSFRITGLPAGEYYVCALVDSGPSPTPDATYLTSLVPASLKITLADGETHTQTFKVGG